MFRWQPRLLVDFIFPTIGSNEAPMREVSISCVDEYIASIHDKWRTTLWEVQAQSMVEACQQKWYYNRKIGMVNLKPGNLILVKVEIGRKKRPGRWCIRLQLMSPCTKWWTNMESHESSTETDFFLLHQRLEFPCVWAAIIHGTGVPAPPHARIPLQEVNKIGCHKRIMVRWSPNDLPVKLPWGG